MKVYSIVPESACVGGCALVAANTREEALSLIKNWNDMLEFFNVSYRAEEIPQLYFEGEEEKIIFDRIYIE